MVLNIVKVNGSKELMVQVVTPCQKLNSVSIPGFEKVHLRIFTDGYKFDPYLSMRH